MLTYPNIFTSQSKEFTQDAFIDWLLRCADPGNPDTATRVAGRAFIRYVIRKNNAFVASLNAASIEHNLSVVDPDIPINEVLSLRQFLHIDVMGRINGGGGLYIIFENKLGSELHDDQLTTYREKLTTKIEKNYPNASVQIIGVYYKVLEEKDYDAVRATYHYSTLSRQEMRDFLSDHTASNPIIQMYHSYLTELDTRIHDWKRMTIAEMNDGEHAAWAFWSGWFSELSQEIKLRQKGESDIKVGWGWINNADGGFHAMWLGAWVDEKNLPTVYLQCDEDKLTIRMSGDRTGVEIPKVTEAINKYFSARKDFALNSRMKLDAKSFKIAELGSYLQPAENARPEKSGPNVKKTADYLMQVFKELGNATTYAHPNPDAQSKHENKQA